MRLRVVLAGVLTFVSFVFVLPPQSIEAATATVSGDCTYAELVAAIDTVGTPSEPAGVVTFDCEDEIVEFAGNTDIKIDGHVIIDGSNGGNQIVLQNDGSEGIFTVWGSGALTAQHLILTGGADVYGGAIYSRGALTVIDSFFLANGAQSGGAILSTEGSLQIQDSEFQFNTANVAGGAINVYGGTPVSITSSIFQFNSSPSGGAIFNEFATMNVSGSTFVANLADSKATPLPDLLGGAIFNQGDLTITDSTFTANRAQLGGAIYNQSTVNATNVRFAANSALKSGGAIYNEIGSTTISQATFRENTAVERGGAVLLLEGTVDISASTFLGNDADLGGSAINVRNYGSILRLAWSTVVQAENAGSAIFIGISTLLPSPILEGVILAGDTPHCEGLTNQIDDSYSLSNDTTCHFSDSTSQTGVGDLGLGALEEIEINGVLQSYFAISESSIAYNAGPSSCDTPDQLGHLRPISAACDIGAIEVLDPFPVCANRWNGQVSVPARSGCGRAEILIELPQTPPIVLCANQWNGSARLDLAGSGCSRSERAYIPIGDDTIPVCVNRWNGSVRVSNRCSRSEYSDAI